MKEIKLLGVNITLGPYNSILGSLIEHAKERNSTNVCLANVHMIIEAHHSSSFKSMLNDASMVVTDGQPLTWALRLLFGIRQERVAGMDLLPDLLLAAEKQNISVAFYGGTSELLDKTHTYLKQRFPNLNLVKLYSPPFRPLTDEENSEIIKLLNASGAQLIFAVLGCPKQEIWMASMKNKLNAVMVGVGGALPVLIGEKMRAPKWMQNSGLEWLYRLGQEPIRLFKRYATTNSLFIYLILKQKFTINK